MFDLLQKYIETKKADPRRQIPQRNLKKFECVVEQKFCSAPLEISNDSYTALNRITRKRKIRLSFPSARSPFYMLRLSLIILAYILLKNAPLRWQYVFMKLVYH